MPTLSPAVVTGLLLAALSHLKALGFSAPSANAVLKATSASRTTAYKAKGAVEAALPDLLGSVGRPQKPTPVVDPDRQLRLARKVVDYIIEHPGSIAGSSLRHRYSSGYHLFVLEQCEDGDLPLLTISEETRVPMGTLRGWLRGEKLRVELPKNAATARSPSTRHIETVVTEYGAWEGDFKAFCAHLWYHLRIPFSRDTLDDILVAYDLRPPKKRRKSAADASAWRGSFETFFPNAQWMGDGCEITVDLLDKTVKVNLELLVDTHSGAFTGASIRSTEDATAVTEAFQDGKEAAGEAPIAMLLDNKPSNHSKTVLDALGDTLLMRSRPFVPTDKPHVEGAFGLFKQEAPPMELSGDTVEQIAAEVARLMVITWARAANHRPRVDRQGKSRADIFFGPAPTDEEKAAAEKALRERKRKQDLARQTKARRQDPVARAALDDAFERLGLEDPDGHLKLRIVSFPLDSILEGIAIFEGRKKAGTLPKGVDGRYLRGIVKNVTEEREGWEIAEALLRERILARDRMLRFLGTQQEEIDEEVEESDDLIKRYVSKAMDANRTIDRTFWLLATADVILEEPDVDHRNKLRLAARRIHTYYAVDSGVRLAAVRLLFAKVVPTS